MVPSPRRRLLLAGLAGTVGLAGCLTGTDDTDEETSDDSPSNDTGTDSAADETSDESEPDADETDETDGTDEREPTVDWDSVPEFRRWLTDEPQRETSNRRFDYIDTTAPTFRSPAIGFIEEFTDDITGSLVHNGHEIHLGEFDRDAVADAAESFTGEEGTATEGIEYERTGSYEGYTLFTDGLAVGDDAVVWNLTGDDATAAIDTRLGERTRLETAEPLFTAVFERLPDGTEVTGQLGPPVGGDVSSNAIRLWGGTRETLESEAMTWIFVADDAAAVTDDFIAELEQVADDPETTVDGRFVRIEGTISLG